MSFVILEGGDGTGKTTMSEKLCTLFDATYVHSGPPTSDDPYREWMDFVRKVDDAGPRIVLDRFQLSHQVYGEIFRGAPDLTWDEFYALESLLSDRGAVLLMMDPPPTFIDNVLAIRAAGKEGLDPRGFEAPEKQDHVWRLFMENFAKSDLPKMKYDPTAYVPTFDEVDHVIVDFIKKHLGWKTVRPDLKDRKTQRKEMG